MQPPTLSTTASWSLFLNFGSGNRPALGALTTCMVEVVARSAAGKVLAHETVSATGTQSVSLGNLPSSGWHLELTSTCAVNADVQLAAQVTTPPSTGCHSGQALCMSASRFELTVSWRNYNTGETGMGSPVPLTSDSGYFWFFGSSNIELVVKVLDGRGVNGAFWVLYGALTDVEYTLAIRDTVTGVVKSYYNPAHNLASVADVEAFSESAWARTVSNSTLVGGSALPAAGPGPTAGPAEPPSWGEVESLAACGNATTLCLNGSRFLASVGWKNYNNGSTGSGQAVPLTSDSGCFWFFRSSNVELVIKILDGTGVNGEFWVLYGALSDVEYTITITDTQTGAVRTYYNPPHTLASVADVHAFADAGTPNPEEITVYLPGNVPLVMKRIPAGTFQMGAPASERGTWSAEQPVHQVTLTSDYYMGKYEVTQAQWKALMGSHPSSFTSCGDSCPVERVSWDEIRGANGFLAKLNAHLTVTGQSGAGKYRLPTEAEWERAARGGTQTRFSFGDALDGDDYCGSNADAAPYVWWCNNASGTTHAVGTKPANPYGLFDVHGNVNEWVEDWWGTFPSSAQTNPTGPTSGTGRVIRGGGWDLNLHLARSSGRYYWNPGDRLDYLGFRLFRSL